MLKIVKSSEPIEVTTIVSCIYAQPGIGKTSMGCTAEKPLTLAFDNGVYRSKFRKDVVRITKWGDVTEIAAEDLAPYKTLIVDTVGSALDFLSVDIIKDDAKMGRGGSLTLQGFGVLKTKFGAWLNLMRSFGLDVVLVSHMDEQKKGDDVSERLDIQGGSKGTVYKSADLMGRIYLVNGKRTLNFSPTDTAFGKNPGMLPELDVPDYAAVPDFFAGVIAQTKAELNKLNAEQTKVAAVLAEWKEKIDTLSSIADFNALVKTVRESDPSIRRMFLAASKTKGLTLDKSAGVFNADKPAVDKTTGEAPQDAPKDAAPPPATDVTPESPAPAREPGSDDGDMDAADRKAAEPTLEEMNAQLQAESDARRKAKSAKGKAA